MKKPAAISHSDRKSDQVDAEKLARYARLRHNALCLAQLGRYAAWTGTGARSGVTADRGDDQRIQEQQ